MKRARLILCLLLGTIPALAFYSAWGCVPYPLIIINPQSSGPAGSEIRVQGLNFTPDKVEIRWNALDGPLLGTAMGTDFSVQGKVPKVPGGLYTVVALGKDAGGGVTSLARASFEVQGAVSATTPAPGNIGQAGDDSERSGSDILLPLFVGGALVAGGIVLGRVLPQRHKGA